MMEFGPSDQRLARILLTKLQDRRVLSAQECCDSCISDALRSLQEIRATLVNSQVELANNGALYMLIELMLVAIRQFLTFEQNLSCATNINDDETVVRHPDDRQQYFDALELLRGHLSRCLGQMAVVAALEVPTDGLLGGYRGPWPLDAYKVPALELEL
jgi:hypothetical protein